MIRAPSHPDPVGGHPSPPPASSVRRRVARVCRRSCRGCDGDVTSVRVCDYGAGNVRSVVLAFDRLGVDSAVRERSHCPPRRGSGRAPRCRVCRERHGAASCDSGWRMRFASESAGVPRRSASASGFSWRSRDLRRTEASRVWVFYPGRPFVFAPGACRASAGRTSSRSVPRTTSRTPTPPRRTAATATSEGIVAEARHGSFTGVQFHPEKSGAAGLRYLEKCLSRA